MTGEKRPPEAERFAALKRASRVWAVGAIHGEAARLARLHAQLETRFGPEDRLVYLGNYLGRSLDAPAAIDELLRFRRTLIARPRMFAFDVAYLRGAQEEMWQKLLQLQFAVGPRDVLEWMLKQGVAETVAAYGGDAVRGRQAVGAGAQAITRWTVGLRQAFAARPGHRALMSVLRRAAYTDDRRLLFVHAGLDPSRPLAAQGDALWWGGPGFAELASPYESFALVVRGYDRAHPGAARGAHTLTVDGGAGFGGPLIAACVTAAGEVVDTIEA